MNSLMVIGFMVSSISATQVSADNQKDALQNVSLALYKQSGMEHQIDLKFKEWQNMYIPKPMQYYIANTAILVQAVAEQKVTYKWSF